ncbi:Muramoyltetrapeptide carboxypeptidase [Alloactinosynnema sp. L-07]|uniref:S66 peptidase family protein n=1 Tax=Alloactinosynnema sp. L-07 TaxID=1653480 RepID=UPI00065EFCF6|nr:LD-carboxypeptidase [Alloactinosynnema sp. L-07]CRK57117.1 Muramoyltetrapeptide carboxypeptidase [Alloactinosynnema sp. L-07]
MTRPNRLAPGSTVAVVAPAGPVDPDRLDHGVAVLESWGLRVTVGKHVHDRHPTLPYLAGRDADRAADLVRAWTDPGVDAVLCARGGYGCQRMVDLLDLDAMAAAGPKVFAGSSDVTVLHAAIGAELGQSTLFAPMIAGDLFDHAAQRHFRATLFEPDTVRELIGPNTATAGHGVAEGITVGGTLSLIAADLGAPGSTPPPDGSILLLEDVAEAPYRIDRLLTQLLRAGWFTGVSGIALGSWADCGDVRPVVADLLASLGVPMVWNLGFGHCPGQLTVPLGAAAVLDADNGTLTMVEPALA